MAEIKSTLELVMERTRNLTMSEEEKREQSAAEFKAGVNRLVQKYLDGQINLDRFRDELDRLEGGPSSRDAAIAQIAGRIEPSSNTGPLLDLLKKGLNKDTSRIEAALVNFHETLDRVDRRASDRIRAELLKSNISGGAVVPNLEADDDRTGTIDAAHKIFRKELAALLRN